MWKSQGWEPVHRVELRLPQACFRIEKSHVSVRSMISAR